MVFRCEELLDSYDKFNLTKDQWENISLHTQRGISFLENYSHFVRDRCQVETEYARNLRRLVKTYLPKKKDDEDSQFTFVKAFREALYETGDLAGQHEVIAETLSNSVATETNNLVKEIKEERKKHLNEGIKLQQQLQQSLQLLEKAKKNYEKAFKEAEKAEENYRKADLDLHLSRAEVEKQKMNSSMKNRNCDDQKNEYANQLQITNELQCLQEMDERRIGHFAMLLRKNAECQMKVAPIISKCLDGIVTASDSIEEKTDSQIVVEKYKSGFIPPSDIQFEDLSCGRPNGGDSTPIGHPPTRQDTIKGTISASKLRKRVGIFGIFASNKSNSSFYEKDDLNDLPPTQRKKRIQTKMDEVSAKLSQQKNSRDGLLKMKEVYSSNPSLGNLPSVVSSLNESFLAIDKLQAELDRLQAMMEEGDGSVGGGGGGGGGSGGPNTPTAHALGRRSNGGTLMVGSSSSPRSSLISGGSDESLSRSTSESSVHHHHHAPPPPPPPPAPHLIPASYATSNVSNPTSTSSSSSNHNNNNNANHHLSKVTSNTTTSSSSSSSKQPAPPTRTSTTVLSKQPTAGSLHSPSPSVTTSTAPAPPHPSSSIFTSSLYQNASNVSLKSTPNSSRFSSSSLLTRNSSQVTESVGDGGGQTQSSDSTYDHPDSSLVAPHAEFDEYDDSFLDQEPLPVIGSCTAVYHFDATSEGSMAMDEGERLHLVELDQGDGWTRVRRLHVFEEGFVPTSYINIVIDNNC